MALASVHCVYGSLEVQPGEIVRLAGPNGCGKTTLLRALAHRPIHVDATATGPRGTFVAQHARDALVGLTVDGEHRLRRRPPPGDAQDVATLSSGEARRLALRFLDGPLWLLDEPSEGLDDDAVARLAARLRASDAAIVFADHDGRLAHVADRTVSLGEVQSEPVRRPQGGATVTWPGAEVRRGERTWSVPAMQLQGLHALHGPNGAGKSTWLRAIAGLDGTAPRIDGKSARPGDIGWLSSDARDHLHTDMGGNAWMPLTGTPWTLSGGEVQRLVLGDILSSPARFLVLDEPEAHLDAAGRQRLIEALDGRTALIATHDPQLLELAQVIEVP